MDDNKTNNTGTKKHCASAFLSDNQFSSKFDFDDNFYDFLVDTNHGRVEKDPMVMHTFLKNIHHVYILICFFLEN